MDKSKEIMDEVPGSFPGISTEAKELSEAVLATGGGGVGGVLTPAPAGAGARARAHAKQAKGKKTGGKKPRTVYPFELKLKLVKKHHEESIPVSLITAESGVDKGTFYNWLHCYKAFGEIGLKPGGVPQADKGREQLPAAVKEAMVETKLQEPTWGIRKISDFVKRFLHLPGSPETVRATLHEHELLEPKPPRPPKRKRKEKRFERATANQMWQTDICTFSLGGKNAYLIGFMDDFSRYMVSLGLYRSQTAEHVLETLRRGIGEFGVPREMLTDNGRQYTNWRGQTAFEAELAKHHIHHIKSRPHHPQTLGKIEHFWKTIQDEFLGRAQFDDFDDAVERVRLWCKYYNHQRTHQGIEGLCPADRFFGLRDDLRQVIERGITENLREIALSGKPTRPFYMVGRVDGQSLVMQASKGRLTMTVGDDANKQKTEVTCDLKQGKVHAREIPQDTTASPAADHQQAAQEEGAHSAPSLLGESEMPGCPGAVDGTGLSLGTMPQPGHDLEHAQPLAGTSHGGDDAGPGAEAGSPIGQHAPEPAPAEPAGAQGCENGLGCHETPAPARDAGAPAQAAPAPACGSAVGTGGTPAATIPQIPGITPELLNQVLQLLVATRLPSGYGMEASAQAPYPMPGAQDDGHATPGTGAGSESLRTHPSPARCAGQEDHGHAGGGAPGGLPQDLARMAGSRPLGHAPGHAEPDGRQATPAGGSGEGTTQVPGA
jgi:transposase InsO family protein/transposase-like protein